MIVEMQICRDIVSDALRAISQLRENPYNTDENIVRKLSLLLEPKEPQAIATLAVVAMLMLADKEE